MVFLDYNNFYRNLFTKNGCGVYYCYIPNIGKEDENDNWICKSKHRRTKLGQTN